MIPNTWTIAYYWLCCNCSISTFTYKSVTTIMLTWAAVLRLLLPLLLLIYLFTKLHNNFSIKSHDSKVFTMIITFRFDWATASQLAKANTQNNTHNNIDTLKSSIIRFLLYTLPVRHLYWMLRLFFFCVSNERKRRWKIKKRIYPENDNSKQQKYSCNLNTRNFAQQSG